jgi:hypothetical protein
MAPDGSSEKPGVASEPEALVRFLGQLGLVVTRDRVEAGPLSQWPHAGARKLASVLHRMWLDGTGFRFGKEVAAA